MECVLRVYGKGFDVDEFLAECPWSPNPVHRRGQRRPVRVRGPEKHEQFGFALAIPGSDTPGEVFADQASAVLAFLNENHAELVRLGSFPGVESRVLDFGVPIYEDQPMRSNHIPLELVRVAATFGLALEITVYACSLEPEAE